ncbi:DNA polymerase IV [hydrothermal vent metagenome]|uniref:DNA-directed DNA polymerase n=1 Tax=hydrothermal vent metagenome TaxID=652676 RepID=A0A3B1B422_9ZZZZ
MILHVDMDAFYASVEMREQPGLADLPIVVGGSAQGRGVVAAANYTARKYGIHSAMPVAQAQRLCPKLISLPVRMALYVEISQQIREIFQRYTPEIEPLSLDEAFLEVSASQRLFGDAISIGHKIKHNIADELSLVASVGIAPSKFVAKIASDINKPDGFVIVTESEVQAFLDPLPVSRLWGVGKITANEFERLGIHTIKQVRQQPLEALQYRFGKFGVHIWNLAQGIDPRKIITDSRAKSISNETTFAVDISDKNLLRNYLLELTEQVAFRLRQQGFYARTVQIKIRFSDFKTITRSVSLNTQTQTTQELWQAAKTLLNTALTGRARTIRLLGMGTSNLNQESSRSQQADLFTNPEREKQREIDQLADKIKNRFGSVSIRRGARSTDKL